MGAIRGVKIVVCVAEEATRNRFHRLLHELLRGGTLAAQSPGYQFEMTHCDSRKDALNCVREYLAVGDSHAAILAFELPGGRAVGRQGIDMEALKWAEETCGELKADCATIAITEFPRRLQNIDRVIGLTIDSATLSEVLKLVMDRLTYTASPTKPTSDLPPTEVRLIRKQRELMDYFKLRHRIYKIMGYLEAEIEAAPSRMEINWCDTIALHFGAFVGTGPQRDFLVGTARVVVGSAGGSKRQPLLDNYRQWISSFVERDKVLQQSIRKGVLPLELPIFQSQRLDGSLRTVLHSNEIRGELSRVIVAEDYRGTGLSTRLVEFALSEVGKMGVNRMFLECLVLHESLYQKLGFQRIPGVPGTVLSVNQTMIGMELSRAKGRPASA